MYRNYDGNKSGFGDTSVNATGPNPDNVSVFAAVRSSDGALTIMVINKQLTASALPTINLANFAPAGTAQVWQLTSANTITRLSDLSFTGSTITNTLPAQSITLFVVPAAILAGPASNPNPADGAVNVHVDTTLGWTAGANATSHRVYFGANSNAVVNATTNSPEFKGNLAGTSLRPGHAGFQRDASTGAWMRWREYTPLPDRSGRLQPRLIRTLRSQLVGGLGSGDSFVITFPSLIGQTYRVERSDSLSPTAWQTVADNVPGTGDAIPIPDTGVSLQMQRFYRVLTAPALNPAPSGLLAAGEQVGGWKEPGVGRKRLSRGEQRRTPCVQTRTSVRAKANTSSPAGLESA